MRCRTRWTLVRRSSRRGHSPGAIRFALCLSRSTSYSRSTGRPLLISLHGLIRGQSRNDHVGPARTKGPAGLFGLSPYSRKLGLKLRVVLHVTFHREGWGHPVTASGSPAPALFDGLQSCLKVAHSSPPPKLLRDWPGPPVHGSAGRPPRPHVPPKPAPYRYSSHRA